MALWIKVELIPVMAMHGALAGEFYGFAGCKNDHV